MKEIAMIADDINEELQGAEHYAKLATQYKLTNKPLAETCATMATQELNHVDMLHTQVAAMIKEVRAKETPPAGMMDVWNYMHEKHIDMVVRVKALLEAYKK